MSKGNVLIIDDEEKLLHLLSRIIELEDYCVFQVTTIKKGLQILENEQDILLTIIDVKLPDGNGIELVETIKNKYQFCEVLVITAFGTIHDGVLAMKKGAFDYLTKGDDNDQILITVERAVEKAKMQKRISELEHKLESKYGFDNIINESDTIRKVISNAQKVSQTDSSVLLEGETGTGKELFAQSIHYSSFRKNKAFVALNCSAFPHDLLESEMFGYKKGAFTGGLNDKKGLIEEANEGTLFLDEIGDMSADLQAKLLRVLENQSFIKIGDTKQTHVNIRIIAATNKDLLKESELGHFRSDLYYRLAAFKINIPPLRERKEDIEPLVTYYLSLFSQKMKKKVSGIDKSFIEKLKKYNWRGNVRELRNVIEMCVILTEKEKLTIDLLPYEILNYGHNENQDIEINSLEDAEKRQIRKILALTHGNKTRTAEMLGIGLTTLYRKLEQYKIE